jgi:hypothetical protein
MWIYSFYLWVSGSLHLDFMNHNRSVTSSNIHGHTHSRQLPKHTVTTSTFITQGKIVFICHILILLFLRVCSKLSLASLKSISPGCMDASHTTIDYLSSLIFQAWVSVIYSTPNNCIKICTLSPSKHLKHKCKHKKTTKKTWTQFPLIILKIIMPLCHLCITCDNL